MEIQKKDYSKLSDVVYEIETKQKQLLLIKPITYAGIDNIPACENELDKFKDLVKNAVALRTPLTKKLDEVKARLMECEKELKERQTQVESNLLQLKKELRIEQERLQRIANFENELQLSWERAKAGYLHRVKAIIESNSTEYLAGKLNLNIDQFNQALTKRIGKEKLNITWPDIPEECKETAPAMIAKYNEADIINEAYKLMDSAINELRNNKPVEVEVKDKTMDILFDHTVKPEVKLVDTKDLKEYYVLEIWDLKEIVKTWISNWDFINERFRVKTIENITIGQVVDIICKHKEEIKTDLLFKKVDKL